MCTRGCSNITLYLFFQILCVLIPKQNGKYNIILKTLCFDRETFSRRRSGWFYNGNKYADLGRMSPQLHPYGTVPRENSLACLCTQVGWNTHGAYVGVELITHYSQ